MVSYTTGKLKPTYDLASLQSAFDDPRKLMATGTAIKGAAAIGMGRREIVDVIQDLRRSDFVKSMTSYKDHTVWQDVYHGRCDAGAAYIDSEAISYRPDDYIRSESALSSPPEW